MRKKTVQCEDQHLSMFKWLILIQENLEGQQDYNTTEDDAVPREFTQLNSRPNETCTTRNGYEDNEELHKPLEIARCEPVHLNNSSPVHSITP